MLKAPVEFYRENVTRYRKLIRGERVDYAPFRLWIDNTFTCQYAGVDPAKYATDWETQFNVQKTVNDRFHDLFEFSVGVNHLEVMFDMQRVYADFPHMHGTRFLEEDLAAFDKYALSTPVHKLKCVEDAHQMTKFFNARLPQHKHTVPYCGIMGCLDTYSGIRGTEKFFMDFYDHPQAVHKIFAHYTERAIAWIDFVCKTWGAPDLPHNLHDKIDIGEDYCAYMPPDLFQEFVIPYTGKIMHAAGKGKLKSLHSDGDFHIENLGKLNDMGVEEFMGFSPNVDIKDVRRICPEIILAGNIHPIKVMNYGTPDDVKNSIRYCFETANQNQKFVLCTGGAIGANAKPENIDAFLDSVYEITKY